MRFHFPAKRDTGVCVYFTGAAQRNASAARPDAVVVFWTALNVMALLSTRLGERVIQRTVAPRYGSPRPRRAYESREIGIAPLAVPKSGGEVHQPVKNRNTAIRAFASLIASTTSESRLPRFISPAERGPPSKTARFN